ncbi:TetR/AcrR family transcriptional regulator [Halocatena pleomorpha]|uniref:TetR/AcrR family transcriptional regulator n=2 Tax=Halocatena pleomorpha TaxID=1785090 RepID=A0A3P3RF58_9EURY|nr:TetR/AcrR family transcriptional regulator [Halocatena pleomorpha]
MGATYRALCKHGYASLRMQDIADESTKSKAALHYHYESKHDLLVAFLEHLYEQFEDDIGADCGDDPATRLVTFVEERLTPRGDGQKEFQTALLEIKAQAPYDEAYRERLAEFDRLVFDRLRSMLQTGIDRGVVDDEIDPEDTAAFLVEHINGAQIRHVTVDASLGAARNRLRTYLTEQVLTGSEAAGSGE